MFTWSLQYDQIYKLLIHYVSCCLVAAYTIWTVLCRCFLYDGSSLVYSGFYNSQSCMLVIYILPAYKKHQHKTVQTVYAATKQQLPRYINSLLILSYDNDHVNIFIYCVYSVVILIILIIS
jgi:hypothetical protein